jgi:putative sterol carrier protein
VSAAANEANAMTDPTGDFLRELARRGREPMLGKAKGTVRLEVLEDGKTTRWLVEIDAGEIRVSRKQGRADCVVRGDKALLDAISRGEVNAWAAMLRGALGVEGDPQVLILFQRLLPGPPSSRGRRPSAAGTGGR